MRFSIACNLAGRLKGLLPEGECPGTSEALLIVPCHDIHTHGMRVPIDVAFIDRDGYVCKSCVNLKPGCRMSDERACAVLERRTPVYLEGVEGEAVPGIEDSVDDGWFHTGERLGLVKETFPFDEEAMMAEEDIPSFLLPEEDARSTKCLETAVIA